MSAPSGAPDAVAALLEARRSGCALPAFPAPGPAPPADAYAAQRRLTAALRAPVLGRKGGRLPPAMIETLGAERVAGPVLRIAGLDGAAPGEAHIFDGGAGAIEAEVMLRLAAVPDRRLTDGDDGAEWIDAIRAGFEIASSPAPDVHSHAPFGIIADIGINNGLLLGPDLPADGFDGLEVTTRIAGESVGTGRARDILDGPWGSLRFLVGLHHDGVIRLASGQWISAGAITGVHPIAIGQTATASFGDGVTIACTAVAETGFAA